MHLPGGIRIEHDQSGRERPPLTITNATILTASIEWSARPASTNSAARLISSQTCGSRRPFKIDERWDVDPFTEFFNLFNRNNPGANYVTVNAVQFPVPAAQMAQNAEGINNVTDHLHECRLASQTAPITSLKQLRIPEGALGDFFGPGTTVGIPFAAQLGVRVTF